MTPPLCFSLSTLPAAATLGPRTLRAPAFAPMSQTCSFAFDPAAARVRGSSGDQEVENTLPYYPDINESENTHETQETTYHAKVAGSDEAHWPLARVLVFCNIPHLDDLVRTTRRDDPADVRVDVEGRHRAVVCGHGEPCGRGRVQIRRQRSGVEVHHKTIFERHLVTIAQQSNGSEQVGQLT